MMKDTQPLHRWMLPQSSARVRRVTRSRAGVSPDFESAVLSSMPAGPSFGTGRGTPLIADITRRWCRFIPARAGNSVTVTDVVPVARRFIPARAGNSLYLHSSSNSTPVHPRACGELKKSRPWTNSTGGSSPRVRGTLTRLVPSYLLLRFIPARAGNSLRHIRRIGAKPVHPRACGELARFSWSTSQDCGSSPRVRGTLTPSRSTFNHFTVHPRACGELLCMRFLASWFSGSSPRVRGTPIPDSRLNPIGRFIPARAGNSL